MTVGDECTCPKCGVIHLCDGFTDGGVTRDDPTKDHPITFLSGTPHRKCVCTFLSINHRMQACGLDPLIGWFCTQCGGTVAKEFAPMYCQCDKPVIKCDNRGCRCTQCGNFERPHNKEPEQMDIEDIIADVQRRATPKHEFLRDKPNEQPQPNSAVDNMSDDDLIAGIKITVENFNILADEAEQRGLRVIAELHPMLNNEIKVTILKEV